MRPLVLIGAGGHCRSCIEVIEASATFRVGSVFGLPPEAGNAILGYRIVADTELAAQLSVTPDFLVTIGQIKSVDPRKRAFERAVGHGGKPATVTSSRSTVSRHAVVGAGSIVMHGAIVNAGARVGNNCIINTGAIIEHDVVVGDNCHISTGALVNGGAVVEDGCFVGSGAVIRELKRIGRGSIVGARAWIANDLPAGSLWKEHRE